MIANYHQLHMFTKLKVRMALRLASLGEKDEARDIARFIRNARIVDILKPYSGELLIDAYLLETELRDLERACHPLSPALSASDKFSQVLSRLDLIAGFLNARADALSGQRTNKLRCNSSVSCPLSPNGVGSPSGRNPRATLKVSGEFSVSVAQQNGAAGGVRLSSNSQPREFPAVTIAPGRDSDRAVTPTLRLRVVGHNWQAEKEKV